MVWPLPGSATDGPVRIVALGDSLTAGFNLPQDAAFPAVLERALRDRGHAVEILNAGVSGDTSTAGLARVDWSVPEGTRAVILELGANDMLRGVDPARTEEALDAIVARLRERDIAVLVAGMRAAPNLGTEYQTRFDAIFPTIAQKHGLVFYPFFLDGVAGDPSLNLADGMHPTAEGVKRIVERMLPTVERFLASLKTNG
ncbi:arylesterase [Chelatococcus sp. SYSU_G07232]|uniref:Arylesterase n=2 Tax=Chelatococcus albus TaxID=3047466 RepID=A0ABT7AKY4_9HYPH|nr:arylesterase [Chelatococcus sp. SYSU_G07232]MDJ1159760.1 arylesterase [Chelatococcus sp. SYSU_G07232]